MELYIVCALIAIALGVLIFKGILFTMFLAYSLGGEDLKWNRSPSLPMQKFGSGSIQRKGSDRGSNYGLGLRSPGSSKVPGAAVYKARPMPPIPRSEKQPLTEIPMEMMGIDDLDDFDSIRPVQHHTSTPMHQLQYQSSPRAIRSSSRTSARTVHTATYQVYPSHELPSPSAASGQTDPYGTIV